MNIPAGLTSPEEVIEKLNAAKEEIKNLKIDVDLANNNICEYASETKELRADNERLRGLLVSADDILYFVFTEKDGLVTAYQKQIEDIIKLRGKIRAELEGK